MSRGGRRIKDLLTLILWVGRCRSVALNTEQQAILSHQAPEGSFATQDRKHQQIQNNLVVLCSSMC